MKSLTITGAALFIASAILFVGSMLNESIAAIAFAAAGIMGIYTSDSATTAGFVLSCFYFLVALLLTVWSNRREK